MCNWIDLQCYIWRIKQIVSKLNTPMKDSPRPEYIIPFTSDFGFKKAFADEKDTTFARKAIQVLASMSKPLKEIKYIRNEKIGLTAHSRKGIIDVFCKDEEQNYFITEMQHEGYVNMFERLIFYVLHIYDILVQKGEGAFDEVKPIHCICISSKKMLEQEGCYHKVSLKNQRNQTVFNKIRFYIVELSKFTKSKIECISDFDKLLYTMKNGHKIDLNNHPEIPPFWGEEWLNKVVEKLKQANLTPEERFSYNIEWAQAIAEREKHEHFHKQMLELGVEKEQVRAKEERVKAEEEAVRAQAEQVRAKEERVKAEEERVKAEEERVKAEEGRVKAEEEAVRVQAEQVRAKEERIKAEVEAARTKREQAKADLKKVQSELEQAKEKAMKETTIAALKNGMSVDQIISILNYPKGFVQKVKEQFDREN